MRRTHPIILGGGPAGASAAIALASAGERPLIIEKARETGDALCGGFLSWRTLARLETLGVSASDLGGHAVTRLRLFAGTQMAEALLPGRAMGVSRQRLDTLLQARAETAGAAIERGVSAKRIDGARATLGDGATIDSSPIIAATGKHDLAGLGRARGADPALGLRVRLAAHPELLRLLQDTIELHLFAGGYAGLVLQEKGDANLCLAVRKSRLAQSGGDPARLLAEIGAAIPALGDRLGFMAGPPAIDAIGAVPYGWIAREAQPGVWRIGDQAGCIPSLAGEGNGIAIASGMRAAHIWLTGDAVTRERFQPNLAALLLRPIAIAKAVWRLCEMPAGGRTAIAAMKILPGLAGMLARATRFGD